MANFKRNVALILLVITLAVSALLLAVSNGFLSTLIDTSVADDCSTAPCTPEGCRIDKGEVWCASLAQCKEASQCPAGGGGNPPPGGSTCSSESSTAAACRGKPVNSTQTYGGLTGRCVINQSPHCAFILNATTPAPQPPAPTPVNPGGGASIDRCPLTEDVCSDHVAGDIIAHAHCQCNADCRCIGLGTGPVGAYCVGDSSCVSGLSCQAGICKARPEAVDNSQKPEGIPNVPREQAIAAALSARYASYSNPQGPECGVSRCSSGNYKCENNLCVPHKASKEDTELSSKKDNDKLRFPTSGVNIDIPIDIRGIDVADVGDGGIEVTRCNPADYGSTAVNGVVVSELTEQCSQTQVTHRAQNGNFVACPGGSQLVNVCEPGWDPATGERIHYLRQEVCRKTDRCAAEVREQPVITVYTGQACEIGFGRFYDEGEAAYSCYDSRYSHGRGQCSFGPRPSAFSVSSESGYYCRLSEQASCDPRILNSCGAGMDCFASVEADGRQGNIYTCQTLETIEKVKEKYNLE